MSIPDSIIVSNDDTHNSTSKQDSLIINNEDDCIFNLKTQTDEFIKHIPEFSNYVWEDSTKTGVIILENGEKLIVKRGGCYHFEISGQWIQKNKKHTIEEVDYWLEQGKWISKRIMTETDYSDLEQMINDKSYKMNFGDNGLYISFNNHNYSEWYLAVDWDFIGGNNNVIVKTGYYFN